jgi:hypothetical protein
VEQVGLKPTSISISSKMHRCNISFFISKCIRNVALIINITETTHGDWIHSRMDFEVSTQNQQQIKKVFCIAPIWNSIDGWTFVYKQIGKDVSNK